MPRVKPEYGHLRAGDVLQLPDGPWYIEGIRYTEGTNGGDINRIEAAWPELQTDALVLSLRRINDEVR